MAKTYPARAVELGGLSKPDGTTGQAYLLRGLVLNDRSPFFEIYVKGGVVLVRSSTLGSSALPMRRRPVVVILESDPEDIYVSVGMAS